MPPVAPQSSGVPLDGGPPMPPSQRAKPSLDQMAGPPRGEDATGGVSGAGVQKAVLERVMLVERALGDIATIMPELAPITDDVLSRLRSGAARILMSNQPAPTAQPAAAPTGAMAGGAPMGMA